MIITTQVMPQIKYIVILNLKEDHLNQRNWIRLLIYKHILIMIMCKYLLTKYH